MGIQLGSEFDVIVAQPIDSRMTVADLTARDAIPSGTRWEGMIVYVEDDTVHYTLKGGITNTDWAIVGGDALPDQTGNAGKFLQTDGTDASWEDVDALPDQAGSAGRYLKTDGTDATWEPISGTGGKNYFDPDSSNLEGVGTASWGFTSANFNLASTQLVAEVLAGAKSLKIEKAAVDASGERVLVTLEDIDRADRGKMLFGSFYYDTTAANYAPGDIRIELYDNTNSAVLYSGPAESIEIPKGKSTFNFVTYLEETTESVDFRLVCNSTNALAYDVFFDEFRLGPAASVNVNIDTQWQDVPSPNSLLLGTTTNPTTPTTPFFKWKRVGSDLLLNFRLVQTSAGTAGSGTYEVALPFGLSSSENSGNAVPDFHVGTGAITTGTSNQLPVTMQLSNGNRLRFLLGNSVTSQTYFGSTNVTYNFGVSALRVNFQVRIPNIIGWDKSQTLTTNELGVQTGLFRASRNGTNQTVGPNNSSIKILFNSTANALDYQRGLVYDAANSRFVNQGPSGVFNFTASLSVSSGTNVLTNGYYLNITVNNGAKANLLGTEVKPAAGTAFTLNATGEVLLANGDIVEVLLFGRGNNSVNTITVNGASELLYFAGSRRPDFTVLGAVRERNKVQTKVLASGVTTDTTITSLGFSGLVIGKWYNIGGQARIGAAPADSIVALTFTNGTAVGVVAHGNRGTTENSIAIIGINITFQATNTNLVATSESVATGSVISGNGTRSQTYVQLTELNNPPIETTEW